MSNKKDYIHKEYPKKCDPRDFFGQVKRTVNGKPISEEEINLIINAIRDNLDLKHTDVLFDIGCGNAALASRLFDSIKGYIGVDFSEYLVSVANENFAKAGYEIILDDAIKYLEQTEVDSIVTKVLCYGVFSYFEPKNAEKLLKLVRVKFPNVKRVFIGNIPDKKRADKFYYEEIDYENLLDDHQSSIGKWWAINDFQRLGKSAGWNAEFHFMPSGFYSAHYRFDVLLKRL